VREFLCRGEPSTELAARLDRGKDHDQHLRGPKFRGRGLRRGGASCRYVRAAGILALSFG